MLRDAPSADYVAQLTKIRIKKRRSHLRSPYTHLGKLVALKAGEFRMVRLESLICLTGCQNLTVQLTQLCEGIKATRHNFIDGAPLGGRLAVGV